MLDIVSFCQGLNKTPKIGDYIIGKFNRFEISWAIPGSLFGINNLRMRPNRFQLPGDLIGDRLNQLTDFWQNERHCLPRSVVPALNVITTMIFGLTNLALE